MDDALLTGHMGGMDHSRQWRKRMRAGTKTQSASAAEREIKTSHGRDTVAATATDGGWEKPLADMASTTAFLRPDVG